MSCHSVDIPKYIVTEPKTWFESLKKKKDYFFLCFSTVQVKTTLGREDGPGLRGGRMKWIVGGRRDGRGTGKKRGRGSRKFVRP